MYCYYHQSEPSVAQCTDCGKFLCKSCASNYEIPLCTECATNRNMNLKNNAVKNLAELIIGIVGGFILAIIYVITQHGGVGDFLAGCILLPVVVVALISLPVGWKALNKITPSFFLWLPIVGWVIYFCIKGIISFFVGVIIFPIRTIKGFIQYNRAKKNQEYINSTYSNMNNVE
ncbi:MAG: hypothetical protein ACI4IG_02185 [Eubacterium sp.]